MLGLWPQCPSRGTELLILTQSQSSQRNKGCSPSWGWEGEPLIQGRFDLYSSPGSSHFPGARPRGSDAKHNLMCVLPSLAALPVHPSPTHPQCPGHLTHLPQRPAPAHTGH